MHTAAQSIDNFQVCDNLGMEMPNKDLVQVLHRELSPSHNRKKPHEHVTADSRAAKTSQNLQTSPGVRDKQPRGQAGTEEPQSQAPTSTETSIQYSYTLLTNQGSRCMGWAHSSREGLFKFELACAYTFVPTQLLPKMLP